MRLVFFAVFLSILTLSSCSRPMPSVGALEDSVLFESQDMEDAISKSFEIESSQVRPDFANGEEVEALSKALPLDYRIGAGDSLRIDVWNRPELSLEQALVGPDGVVSIPRLGSVQVSGKTRDEAALGLQERLQSLYDTAEVSVTVLAYRNNRAYVLGRVAKPGVVNFTGPGTLIEAITLAGGVSARGMSDYSAEVAIIRGKSQIIWVDLDDLLNQGNMALNARIQNNDVVFVPADRQELVYVMGEVRQPRAVALTRGMTYMDALMLAGGPTEDSDTRKTYLLRSQGQDAVVKEINLQKALTNGNFSENYLLKDNDVIYVEQKGIARFNYYIRQVTPTLRLINLGATTYQRVTGQLDDVDD